MAKTFGKEERLCSHIAIEELFERGNVLYFHPLKIYYLILCPHQKTVDEIIGNSEAVSKASGILSLKRPAVKVLFSAPKKHYRHAVDRNGLKRQMREAYRQNKSLFEQKYCLQENNLYIAFVYTSKKMVSYLHIEESIQKGIQKICESIDGLNNGVQNS